MRNIRTIHFQDSQPKPMTLRDKEKVMSAERNKQVIERIYAAMAEGDRSVFAASVHPDYVWRFPGHCSWSRRFDGQEPIHRDLLRPLFGLFATDYTARAINLVAEGDMVVAEVRGDVMLKSGKRYDNHYCFIFHFRDGKIAEVVEYCDTDLEERVLGNYDIVLAAYRASGQD
jgi:ketosteroid isomerase-like protein